jgi:hypothetical protein
MTERPPTAPRGEGADDSRAEQVLSQALRVMAGGGKALPAQATPGQVAQRRLSTSQLILLAVIVGLLLGIVAGFVSLMF